MYSEENLMMHNVSNFEYSDKMKPAQVLKTQNALVALMHRTGYSMIQENGQRKYGGPPPDWEGPAPPRGCEVFVGKVPRDCYEDELVPVFEAMGRIYELRLMMDFSGTNRGYCFVMYTAKKDAKRAVKELDRFEIRKGRFLGVNFSVDNCRLYIGSIPRDKTREDILDEMRRKTDGVVDVLVYPSSVDKTKNRGFAFVEYDGHRSAALARKKVIPGKLELWGQPVIVDWAEPEPEVDDEVMEKVRNLYVRNLMPNTSEETLKVVFERASGHIGSVERVKRIKDFAFVHFFEREHALKALQVMNGCLLEGAVLEVALAKPVLKGCCSRHPRILEHGVLCPDSTHEITHCVPRLNKDGSLLREKHFFDLHPDELLRPADPPNQLTAITKNGVQLLLELCLHNHWGEPLYCLHTAVKYVAGQKLKLYIYKIVIPGLANTGTDWIFHPNMLCDDMDGAKEFAATFALKKIGVVQHADLSKLAYPGGDKLSLPATSEVLAQNIQPLITASGLVQPVTLSTSFNLSDAMTRSSTTPPVITSPRIQYTTPTLSSAFGDLSLNMNYGGSIPQITPGIVPAYNFQQYQTQ